MARKRKSRAKPQAQGTSLDELQERWEAEGPAALASLRKYDASAYVRLLAEVVRAGDDE